MASFTHYQPYWFNKAFKEQNVSPQPTLLNDIDCQVCIVGGGFTGLWTAIKLKQKSPSLNIVIIEKGICGQGASGRNGGCMLTYSTKFNTLHRLFGLEEAVRIIKASEQAVFDIKDFCIKNHIVADIRTDGAIYSATNFAQETLLEQPLTSLKEHGINQWQSMVEAEAKRLTGSPLTKAAIKTDKAGSLDPGKLVLGLRKHVLKLGVRIFENSPMLNLSSKKRKVINTPEGSVTADKVVLGVNSSMGELFKEFNKYYLLVSSDMLITKPQPERLKSIGLDHGMAIADSRIFVHYYRTTIDGRLMLGKGGNMLPFANKLSSAFEKSSKYSNLLTNSFSRLFPELEPDIEVTWTGASDRSATGIPFFGELQRHYGVYYGLGYSGNGVVQSYLGGAILSSMVLNQDNAWTRSQIAKGPQGTFPPEPFRYFGAHLVKSAVNRKERFEDLGKTAYWLDKQLARLASSAGKSDK